MFKNFLKKTTEKAENAIEDVTKDAKEVMANANDFVDISKTKVKKAVTIIISAFAINTAASLLTIYCCSKVIKSINRNDVLNEIARAIREGGK